MPALRNFENANFLMHVFLKMRESVQHASEILACSKRTRYDEMSRKFLVGMLWTW